MLKKISAVLVAAVIITTASINAFAGPTEDYGYTTTRPAINTAGKTGISSTGSAITDGVSTTTGAIVKRSTSTGGAIERDSSSTGSAIAARKANIEKILANVLRDGKARDDSSFIMNITSPDKDKDSTYMKSYVLSGNSKYSDVVISIAKYNENTGEYVPMYNTDGESSWEIGEFRLFSKEIILTEGTNKIKILAYRASEADDADDMQVNCFTIELLKESIMDRIIKGTDKIINKTQEIGSEIGNFFGLDNDRFKELFSK